jgi:hypothetical protein
MVWGFVLPGVDHNADQFLSVRFLAAQHNGYGVGQLIGSV